jgi:hypothetical protein
MLSVRARADEYRADMCRAVESGACPAQLAEAVNTASYTVP